jgi:hypothetical protein
MSIQEWAIRDQQRDHQRHAGAIAMLKGEAERARAKDLPSRKLVERAHVKPV